MTNKPPVQVGYTDEFKRNVKRLRKKYRRVQEDVEEFLKRLQAGELPGAQIPGTGYPVYKVRLRSSDLTRGKSGGYRVIYYLRTTTFIVLLTLYAKTQRADISSERIRQLIEEYEPPSE